MEIQQHQLDGTIVLETPVGVFILLSDCLSPCLFQIERLRDSVRHMPYVSQAYGEFSIYKRFSLYGLNRELTMCVHNRITGYYSRVDSVCLQKIMSNRDPNHMRIGVT